MAIFKRARELVTVSLTILLLLLAVPLGAYAAEYTRLGNLVSVDDAPGQKLNTVKVTAASGELRPGDVVVFRLPEDFSFNAPEEEWEFGSLEDGSVYYGSYDDGCYIYVPWDNENGLNMSVEADYPVPTDILSVSSLRENEIKIEINSVEGYPSLVEDSTFFIYLKDVDVAKGFSGAIELSFFAPGGSGFGEGRVDGGRVGRIVDKPDEEEEEEQGPQQPENGESKENKIVFTLGRSSFTVDGVMETMDAAPYAKGGRTYLPIRYVARALGIPNANISWKNGTAYFKQAGTVMVVSLGSPNMTVNGKTITMDALPELNNGRVMLPIKWIGEAFGVDVAWDAAAQTVTIQ